MQSINNYQSAIRFIQSHGHFATLTPDGVLAQTQCRMMLTDEAFKADDVWFDENTVFPVDHDGNVKPRDVRAWLGY